MDTEIKTKVCSKCGRTLPQVMFSKCASAKDGLQAVCKACHNEQQREHYAKKKAEEEKTKSENVLSAFTPRQLMSELKRRGYDGTLTYVQRIKLSEI